MLAKREYLVKRTTEQRINIRFGFALALLLILAAVLYQTTLKFSQTERWESRIEAEVAKLDEISSLLKDAEAGERGYLLTGDEDYLEPYHTAIQTSDQELSNLRAISADNPSFRRKIEIIAPLIAAKLAVMTQLYNLRRTQGLESVMQTTLINQDEQITNDTLRAIEELKNEQSELLQQKTDELDGREQAINLSITFGSFIAIMLAVFMISREII
jgi:CHASE3 domain sensor protein